MVVDYPNGRADDLFHALADATRRDIVMRSLQAEFSVSALARFYPISFAAVQKHVAVLERADLVEKRRHGRQQLVRANIGSIHQTVDALEQFEAVWRGRFDRFGEALAQAPDRGGSR